MNDIPEGFIRHDGSRCPLPPLGPSVLVKLRCGITGWVSPVNTKWDHGPTPHDYDIIAYKPEPAP